MSQAPDSVKKLVDQFQYNLTEFKSPKYNETQIRVQFVNPLWEALEWDISNKSGKSMMFCDVVHEADVKVGGATKAPDYAFRIGGQRIFFLETKKPSIDIKHALAPAFQLRRYAYSAKLPVSLLTDFEELSIYDCRIKPAQTDKPHVSRMSYYGFTDYVEKWEEIYSIFSKTAVERGAFHRYIDNNQKKRPGAELDRDFLNDLDHWRMELARNIALRNPSLSDRELNYAVQMTIDRLIFLRMAEDRGIENPDNMRALLNGEHTYKRLIKIYDQADEKYNSGLFHFSDKDGPNPDTLTPDLALDDKVLKEIIKHLYYPDCPYEFSVLPVEVLGNAYEQFLGKRITLTQGHRARIEEKPEVRKAGGVYYTPQYIVDYIVENTVGELVKEKSTRQVSDLRILDPACGSGSFLLGAYQYLLDWHLKTYKAEYDATGVIPTLPPQPGARKRKSDPQVMYAGPGDEWYLTTAEKKRILLNNIYGVDIDANAVEVTKLSLLLKVLEHENRETVHSQITLWHERALPNLGSNIKCGNSLIGSDYYDNIQGALFDETEQYRINAFDWDREFPEIFNAGGFDAVIGNPPYIRSQFLENNIKKYLSEFYESGSYQPDTFAFFIEKAIKILRILGRMSFIIPNGILTNTYYKKLREFIINNSSIEIIVDLKEGVFQNVSVDTSILVLNKQINKNSNVYIGECKAKNIQTVITPKKYIDQNLLLTIPDFSFNTGISNDYLKINTKIFDQSVPLEKFLVIKNGMKVRTVFIANKQVDDRYKQFLKGSNVSPYCLYWKGLWVCYDKANESKYTNQAYRDESIFQLNEKILVRQVMGKKRIYATIDNSSFYVDQSLYILYSENKFNLKLVLGILNSKLMSFYFQNTLSDRKITFPKIKGAQLKQLPIFNFERTPEETKVTLLEQYVCDLLSLNEKVNSTRDPQSQKLLQRQIVVADRRIDQLVYELYGLTDDEIKIVEEAVG